MLRLFTVLFISLSIVSCKKEQPTDGYLINGTIDASVNNRKIKIIKFENNNEIIIDSATFQNGKATLKGKIDTPNLYQITIDGVYGSLPIVLENKKMSISFNKNNLLKSTVEGSEENNLLKIYYDDSEMLKTKNAYYGKQIMTARENKDTLKMNELKSEFIKIRDDINAKHIELVKNNPNLVTSAAILGNIYIVKGISKEEARNIFDTFSQEVTSSDIGVIINEKLTEVTTDVGNIAPGFSAPNPEGKLLSLEDIKGKVTIIDFWAAWCGPCRKENPNVVKVYEKYHDKGLEIIGVSLDGTPSQKDAKAAWVEAIEKDKLTWHQVSNLAFFNDPIAKLYNIQAIPATFILDSEGKIVAKNLRGEALEAKIAELLN
ncbi:redoxin family protein [Flavobacteriaceae bacterium LYZ1037]|nr:redoxin family protein [Flavobacteriaceae bacterium LYZ1037]